MAGSGSFTHAFGKADSSSCGREQVHVVSSIQSHGVLLVLREPDYVVVQASANAAEMFGLPSVLGRSVASLDGGLGACISSHLSVPTLHPMPLSVQCSIGTPRRNFDVVLHRPPQGGLVIEMEPAMPLPNRMRDVEDGVRRILAAFTLETLCEETAGIIRKLTGYDRVIVYRFDREEHGREGHGKVLAEERSEAMAPFQGNRHPATDIPQMARRPYERNRVRVLVDVGDTPVPVLPEVSPITSRPLDMSICMLRNVSPDRVRDLRSMGVSATLVVSLMVGGRLWGLIACHHATPRKAPFQMRVMCELLSEAVATRIAALESSMRGQAEVAVRRLELRLIEAIRREGDWRGTLFDSTQPLLPPLGASGAVLLFDGQITVAGEVPGTQQLSDIGNWLDAHAGETVFSTASLGLDEPAFSGLCATASGLVAVSLSRLPGEYLLWFRPGRARAVTSSGDSAQVLAGGSSTGLLPQAVDGTSEPWTEADLVAARLIGDTVRDVILQFRSVGLLIAHEQVARVRSQVQVSDLPVVVADADGRILLLNDAFRSLVGHAVPGTIMEVAALFTDDAVFRVRMQDLMERRLIWRGEVTIRASGTPLLLRADPVFSSPDQVSGFVLLFTDLVQQKAAEAARRSFEQRIVEHGRVAGVRAGAPMQALFSSVVQNAQLAALEITDGVDLADIPAMLESVRVSVSRTRRALDHLEWHADSLLATTAGDAT